MVSNKQESNIKIYVTQDYLKVKDNDPKSIKQRLRFKE